MYAEKTEDGLESQLQVCAAIIAVVVIAMHVPTL